MNSKRTVSFLLAAGIVLYIVAFVLNIVLDIIAKDNVLAKVFDRIVWILFGVAIGLCVYSKKGAGDGKRKDGEA